jgi:hypothetical protein
MKRLRGGVRRGEEGGERGGGEGRGGGDYTCMKRLWQIQMPSPTIPGKFAPQVMSYGHAPPMTIESFWYAGGTLAESWERFCAT